MTADADLAAFATRIGYSFQRPELLQQALSHRSWCAEHPGAPDNERLEFLGDAVLSVIVTRHIFDTYPDMTAGMLALTRSEVVSSESLAALAEELGVGEVLRLSSAERASGGSHKPSILTDTMEAVIGALYVEAPYPEVESVVLGWLQPRIQQAAANPGGWDYKSQLAEYVCRSSEGRPMYSFLQEGPHHDPWFRVTVFVDDVACGVGEGRKKKQAEQMAAAAALERLQQQESVAQQESAPEVPS